jgi:acetolactate synthase II small subunit
MIYSLHIEADSAPAMLERILQTTRIRGFDIRHFEVQTQNMAGSMRIAMTVESSRNQDRLTTQIRKIYGVRSLTALHEVEEDLLQIQPGRLATVMV